MTMFAEYLNGIAVVTIGETPTTTLTVKGDTNATVLNKAVADIQSGITVKDNAITGKLKYVSGWTDYSALPEENSGHFIALEAEPTDGATVTVQAFGDGVQSQKVTMDSDLEVVMRLEKPYQFVEFTATKSGDSIIKRYDISKLIKE